MQLEPELCPSLRRATVSKLVDRRSDRQLEYKLFGGRKSGAND